jgi:hypothetical protein
VITGQVIIMGKVESVGYAGLYLTGQILAQRGSESALSRKIRRLSGQMLYYPEGARILIGDDEIGREFLELLPAPTPLFFVGKARLMGDIPLELLRAKVPEIGLVGKLIVPAALRALVQAITVEKTGEIAVEG